MRRRFGLPLVYTVHNALPHNTGANAVERYGRLYQQFNALICHSEVVKQELVSRFGVEQQRIWVIPHGPLFADLQQSDRAGYKAKLKLRPEHTLFLMQGVISDYKGVDVLLKAWSILHANAKTTAAHLLISGTGDPALQARLRDLKDSLGLDDSVTLDFRFIPVEELGQMYSAADVAVYPYRQISTSGALLTGIAFAKPIIASDLEPFREALGSSAARLVKREDPDALANALLELHLDEQLRQQISGTVRKLQKEDTSWKSIANKTISCYEAVLKA
jgi:glycosyltransferase involved in cell wall biosynthesis